MTRKQYKLLAEMKNKLKIAMLEDDSKAVKKT